jgi:hypothetical protein
MINFKSDLKITYGKTQDGHLVKLQNLAELLQKLNVFLDLDSWDFGVVGDIDERDLLFLLFYMSITYQFDTRNIDCKDFLPSAEVVIDKKSGEKKVVALKPQHFFSKDIYSLDFFELKPFLNRVGEGDSEDNILIKNALGRNIYNKKDNYIHFLLALLFNLKLVHNNQKLLYDCFKVSDFECDDDFSARYKDLKQDLCDFFENAYRGQHFEFFKNICGIVYELHFLRKFLFLDFNVNFKKYDMSGDKIKVSMENVKQLIILYYSVKNRYGFVQGLAGNIKTNQLWQYNRDTHTYEPLEVETSTRTFLDRFRKIVPNRIFRCDDSKSFRSLVFGIKDSFSQYFSDEKNVTVYLKKRQDKMLIAFKNGVLKIDKKKLNTYEFTSNFDPNEICLLSFNFDFNESQFRTLINYPNKSKLFEFLSWSVYEVRDSKGVVDFRKMDFLSAIITNHFQVDEEYHVTASFIGQKGSGKTKFMRMLTHGISKTGTLAMKHSPYDYERTFFTPSTALTVLYAFNSENDVRDYTNNSNVKSAIAREFVSVNRKYEDIENVEVHAKFMSFAEQEPKSRHDGGLFERSLYFYFAKRKELFQDEINNFNGDISEVVLQQTMGLVALFYRGVQFQIENIFGHDARIYRTLYNKIFIQSNARSLEHTNSEITKLKSIVHKSKSFMYKKDFETLYDLVAKSGLSSEINSSLASNTLMSYLRQWSENEADGKIFYEGFLLNNKKFGIAKRRPLLFGIAINDNLLDSLLDYYKDKSAFKKKVSEIKENYEQLYTDEDTIENIYTYFGIHYEDSENNELSATVELKLDKVVIKNGASSRSYLSKVNDIIDNLPDEMLYKYPESPLSDNLKKGGADNG